MEVSRTPSAAASRILEGYRPPYTATAVERLAAEGAPCMDEFAMGSSNESSGGPVIPLRETPSWRKLYRGCAAVERGIGRLKKRVGATAAARPPA